MVRTVGIAAGLLALALGCSGDFVNGVKTGAEQSFDRKFRSTFVSACEQQAVGAIDPKLQHQVCACVADELVHTKTPGELADLITSPTLPEVQPILENCARKALR